MDIDSRIKVLNRRITVHKSEIPSGRDTSSQATHLQLRQFIGQDLAALELCFENQKDFNDYTTKHSIGNTPHLYLPSIYEWLPDVCILWITLDNNSQRMYKMASLVGQWRSKNTVHRWLFIKRILETNFAAISLTDWQWQLNRLTNSFHSIEDDGERDGNQSTRDDMILSNSIVNLNIK